MFYRFILLLSGLFFLPVTYGNNIDKKSFTVVQQEFSKTVTRELKNHNIPGAAYAIIKNNHIVALETYGYTDKNKSKKITPDTVFRLASVSKPFAATITTMLAQEEYLNLSDPVTKYIPNFVLAKENAAEKITLEHLLSHSSGLMPNTYDNLLHENWNMEKIIGRFNKLTPICRPGKCYGYQNIAYGFLEFAVESSQPKSFETLLQERIFTPLKMNTASVGFNSLMNNKNTAKPHVLIKSRRTNKKDRNGKYIKEKVWYPVKVQPDYYKVASAAGINASITDLAKWLNANMGNNPEVLSTSLLNELTTPRIKTKKDLRLRYWRESIKDAHYGFGWRIYQFEKGPIIYHSGWVQGYRASIGYSPELGIGIAMLMNAESNLINKLSHDFWQAVHE